MTQETIKPVRLGEHAYQLSIRGEWWFVHNEKDKRWHLYSVIAGRYMSRNFRLRREAKAYIEYLKADIDTWQHPGDCSANQWMPYDFHINNDTQKQTAL